MSDYCYIDLLYVTKGNNSCRHTIKMRSKRAAKKWSLDKWIRMRVIFYGETLPCGDDEVIKISAVDTIVIDRRIPA